MNKTLPVSEHEIQNNIMELLQYHGYMCWRNNVGATKAFNADGTERWTRFGQPGFSDIFAIAPKTGRFVALEVKKPETRHTATYKQIAFIERVTAQGGIAAVVC